MKPLAAKIRVGTASWSDPEFVRDWYPGDLRPAERLPYYAERFNLVELNSSFYGVPTPKQAEEWVRLTPAHFTFDVKLHQLLSRHSCGLKMLPPAVRRIAKMAGKDRVALTHELEKAMVEEFLAGLEPLERSGKLGVLLLQLSPSFSPRTNRLEELEAMLDRLAPRSVAVELRNCNWVERKQLEITSRFLADHATAFVSVDTPKSNHFNVMPRLDLVTNPRMAYLRLHGRDEHAYLTGKTVADRFNYDYSDEELNEVKERVEELGTEAEFVHVIFNNNRLDFAPRAALRFRRVLGQVVVAEGGGKGLHHSAWNFDLRSISR